MGIHLAWASGKVQPLILRSHPRDSLGSLAYASHIRGTRNQLALYKEEANDYTQ